jgi:hypothetical protein
MFESRHISRHFEKRRRQTNRKIRRKSLQTQANRQRSDGIKRLRNLSLAVQAFSLRTA